MQSKRFLAILSAAALIIVVILTSTIATSAVEYKAIFKFKWYGMGRHPLAGVVFGADGKLYGTTEEGGLYHGGTVFCLTPNPGGDWSETVIYSFTGNSDGKQPVGDLVFDTKGTLYGTTYSGGINGLGGVFRLTPNPDGSWTETTLYSFAGGADGSSPMAGVILDGAGNLYGTTVFGGNTKEGTAFELMANPDGTWTERLLYTFTLSDGSNPKGGLVFDRAGNLYGTTSGGNPVIGTVFKLAPNPDGSWTESTLHDFRGGGDGYAPVASLIFDAQGNLYGTTSRGGGHKGGSVFQLQATPDGSWNYQKIHSFGKGDTPTSHLVADAGGSLYGTTMYGGPDNYGRVFRLSPNPDGTWASSKLHYFKGNDGEYPYAGLILDASGNLYGTTWHGAKEHQNKGNGVVFEITP